ncbi:hypothetical protein U1Q18_046401 [Sarracenia purpurea var. burkii]
MSVALDRMGKEIKEEKKEFGTACKGTGCTNPSDLTDIRFDSGRSPGSYVTPAVLRPSFGPTVAKRGRGRLRRWRKCMQCNGGALVRSDHRHCYRSSSPMIRGWRR